MIGVCAKQTISGRRIPPRGVLAKSDKVVLVLSETVLVLVIEFRKVEIMVLSEWSTDPADSDVRLPGVARESREWARIGRTRDA